MLCFNIEENPYEKLALQIIMEPKAIWKSNKLDFRLFMQKYMVIKTVEQKEVYSWPEEIAMEWGYFERCLMVSRLRSMNALNNRISYQWPIAGWYLDR